MGTCGTPAGRVWRGRDGHKPSPTWGRGQLASGPRLKRAWGPGREPNPSSPSQLANHPGTVTGWVRVSLGLSCRWQKIQVKELTCWCQCPRCTGKGWGCLDGGPLLATVAQPLSSRRDAGSQHQQRCRQSLTPVCGHNSCPEARPGSSDSWRSSGADGRFWFIRGLPGHHPRGEGGDKGDLKCPHREAAA